MMTTALTHHWRPRQHIRALAIGLFYRDDRLLAAAVPEDQGQINGWRPLGGGIEFGERADAALIREMSEEIGATLGPVRQIGVMENLFLHEGDLGHEIVFILTAELRDPGQAAAETFILNDEGSRSHAAWMPLADFRSGAATLLPEGLLAFL